MNGTILLKNRGRRRGFTLVEVMVAVSIVAGVVSVVFGFVYYYLRSYSFSFEEYRSINQAQSAFTIMIREIREARTGENGAWPIAAADDNSLVFYSDVSNDGRTDRVRYFLEGRSLKRGVIEPVGIPASYPTASEKIREVAPDVDNLGAPVFVYYNGDWPGTVAGNPLAGTVRISDTRYIEVGLRIDVNKDVYAAPFQMSSGVQIRSLKNNQ